jgi:hypothetical protein
MVSTIIPLPQTQIYRYWLIAHSRPSTYTIVGWLSPIPTDNKSCKVLWNRKSLLFLMLSYYLGHNAELTGFVVSNFKQNRNSTVINPMDFPHIGQVPLLRMQSHVLYYNEQFWSPWFGKFRLLHVLWTSVHAFLFVLYFCLVWFVGLRKLNPKSVGESTHLLQLK